MENFETCPCHSKKEYAACCKPFHEGTPAQNALQLMRSRYSAYALNLGDYIVFTTHPDHPECKKDPTLWKLDISNFSHATTFENLVILDFKETGNTATVTFTAYLSQNGKNTTFTECSYFEKMGMQWLYKDGYNEPGYAPHLVIHS